MRKLLYFFLFLSLLLPDVTHAGSRLKIMSFNAWGAGSNQGKSIEETVAVIQALNPDIIGLQEIRPESVSCDAEVCPPGPASVAPQLAAALGYELLEQLEDNEVLWANAILSRFPIESVTPGGLGAQFNVNGKSVVLFNIHLTDYPYQPYQLLNIPYGDAEFLVTAAAAEESAKRTRGPGLALLEADLATVEHTDVILITGDFNEPSHLDWTAEAVAAGLHPLVVNWPFTWALGQAGFTDTFRAAHPDEVEKPGFTWSPMMGDDDLNDHRDRIDYVFVRGAGVKTESAAVAGENSPWTDEVIEPWPSDHRAVISVITF
jgi:endonuclease/exonuclease/phosphatase family metal-dependent hydrolase